MTKEATRPNYLDISSHFLHDAIDFEVRYKHCINSEGPLFYTPRSRRAKCFIDLRMGIEAILKSFISYHEHQDRKGKRIINWIEKFGHKIEKMIAKAKPHLPQDWIEQYEVPLLKLDNLPVGLRYRLDAWDFRGNKEELYYDTIGSDVWLGEIHSALIELTKLINSLLKKHDRILGGNELLAEMEEVWFEKYT
ncbi:hypothetical protein Q3O60_05295 [Alkalimonas collagenimarina]|uniref:Uncharacterized protein n=1 Tax=Alkalimonas collagenimarina TaxID=400390 RepID=A0ABT9GX06_9GAMM|nr:hypothetical protein [Alkalimonas collagenimarina]MDP4535593.1 hypothetical protein [Alkalimonas collagenimarina]